MTRFIDVHVHPPVAAFINGTLGPRRRSLESHSAVPLEAKPIDEIAETYRSLGGRAVLLGWHDRSPRHALRSEDIAALVAAAPDVFRGFGAVDPRGGAAAVAAVHETSRLGLDGLSFHPAAQGIAPNERATYPVWECAEEHDLVCLVHTGYTRLGAGESGGGGVRLDVARPTHVDTVAADFPALRMVMSHTGSLWLDEAIAMATHKTNIWFDLSGQRPTQFSDALIDAILGPLRHRCLFGSDFPFAMTSEQWIGEWEKAGLGDELSDEVLFSNAAGLLGWL